MKPLCPSCNSPLRVWADLNTVEVKATCRNVRCVLHGTDGAGQNAAQAVEALNKRWAEVKTELDL